jgi:IclR family pca regulon transcriptional regulator
VAEHYLRRLFEEVDETVNLAILDGAEILYLIRIRRDKYLPFDIRIGTKLPVYCTGMGKALMALGRPEIVEPILAKLQFRPLTPRTIIDLPGFKNNLAEVRQKGYALNDEELSIGNRAVSVPVSDKNGFAAAAINIAVPTTRFTVSEMEDKLLPGLMRTAQEIAKAWRQLDSVVPLGDFS